jgi:acid phosphatase
VNDGHDSTIDIAGNWSRSFLAPLLNNTSFMNRTLVLVTFDENETYTIKNKIWGVLLGDVIPANLRGTKDNTFYTHYSAISTIEANWALYHLGRGDVITNYSNVFSLVANSTGYQNAQVADADIPYFNFTSVGYFDTTNKGPIPAVDTTPTGAGGRGVLPVLKGAQSNAINPPIASSSSAAASGSGSATGAAGGSTASAATSAAIQQVSRGSNVLYFIVVLGFAVGLVV